MTISEKIERLHQIPKKISENQEDRDRLKSLTATQFDKIGDSASKNNSAESKNISYADKGRDNDILKSEYEQLKKDIQSEINSTIIGDDEKSTDMRRILKAYYLDGHNLKYIGNKIVNRNYTTVKELYKQGCNKLNIAPNCP